MIHFKEIKIEGFASVVDPITFQLDRAGVNMLSGKNGLGKTTLFSALLWALFGDTLKSGTKAPSWKQRRGSSWRGTRVVVKFSIAGTDYAIARHIGFQGKSFGKEGKDSFMLFDADGEIGRERHKEDLQGYVNSLLGYSKESFLNSVIFGQGMKRFVETESADKREFLEELFSLGFIADLKAKGLAKIAELLNQQQKVKQARDILIVEENYLVRDRDRILEEQAEYNEMVERVQEVYADKSKTLVLQLDREKKELQAHLSTKRVDEVNPVIAKAQLELDGLCDFRDKYRLSTEQYQYQLRELRKELSSKQLEYDQLTDTCPKCHQVLPDAKALKKLKSDMLKDLSKLEKDILEVESLYEIQHKQLNESQAVIAETEAVLKELNFKEREAQKVFSDTLYSIEKSVLNTSLELKNLEEQHEKYATPKTFSTVEVTAKLEEILKKIETLSKELEDKQAEIERYQWWDKSFGASGIKAYLFESLLSDLNEKIDRYARRLNIGIYFGLDITKKSKPFITKVTIDDVEDVDYNELSGGQKQRVSICMSLAIYDVLSEQAMPVNMLVLDEVFENLDAEGTEVAFEFIQEKAKDGKSVYVITHLPIYDTSLAKNIEVSLNAQGSTVYGG